MLWHGNVKLCPQPSIKVPVNKCRGLKRCVNISSPHNHVYSPLECYLWLVRSQTQVITLTSSGISPVFCLRVWFNKVKVLPGCAGFSRNAADLMHMRALIVSVFNTVKGEITLRTGELNFLRMRKKRQGFGSVVLMYAAWERLRKSQNHRRVTREESGRNTCHLSELASDILWATMTSFNGTNRLCCEIWSQSLIC